VRISLRGGMSEDEIAAIKTGATAPIWQPADAALIAACDDLHERQFVRNETWAKLKAHFTDRQCMDAAWPLAERYEAILRVFNNPEPYARRLAARLHATAHRLRELFRAPPEAQHRIDQYDMLTAGAEGAAAVFNSS
jgi:hypothetical protein